MELLIILGIALVFAAVVEMSPLRSDSVDDDCDDGLDVDAREFDDIQTASDRFQGKDVWGKEPSSVGHGLIGLSDHDYGDDD